MTETQGGDGYVSIEVSPYLAHETGKTVEQARALWGRVDRPNLMVKIPATPEGIPAIRQAIAAGINVNVTLIFSLARYAEVMEAYLSGLEDRLKAGLPIDHIASVASFFVSRVDTKVDKLLPEKSSLRGQAAIANARLAYAGFPGDLPGRPLGSAQVKQGQPAASAVGFHQHQRSRLPRYALCRYPDRPEHGQHRAAAYPGCIPRSRRAKADDWRRSGRSPRALRPAGSRRRLYAGCHPGIGGRRA